MMKNTLLGLISLALAVSASADQSESNNNLWLNYVGDHPLGDGPWGIHLESQIRRADFGEDWQQLLLRAGINYTLSPQWSLTAGYGWIESYKYGEFPAAADFPENRFFEQASVTHKALGLDWTHRFRLEQRRIGEVDAATEDVTNWRYENRFRYMLRTSIPLCADKKWYLPVWNEIFFNFGSNVSKNYFDQNRAFIGIGRQLAPSTKLEVGFMEQTIQRRGGEIWENNHTITVWLTSKFPLHR